MGVVVVVVDALVVLVDAVLAVVVLVGAVLVVVDAVVVLGIGTVVVVPVAVVESVVALTVVDGGLLGALTVAVASEAATAEPFLFVAVTTTRSVELTSVVVGM